MASRSVLLEFSNGEHILLEGDVANGEPGFITSNLKQGKGFGVYAAINGLETLVLAQYCAGVDVLAPAYMAALETAVESICNDF